MPYKIYFKKTDGFIWTMWCSTREKLDVFIKELKDKGITPLKIKKY